MHRFPLLIVVVLSLLLASCAGGPGSRADSPLAAMGESAFAEGSFATAAQAFLDAAENSRSDRDYFRLRAAEAWRENGSLAAARQALQGISDRRLDDTEKLRLALLSAELALADRDSASARRWLEGINPGVAREPRYRARYLDLRGRAYEREDAFFAARAYAELGGFLEGRERSENARRIRDLLSSLRDADLRSSAGQLRAQDPLRPYAVRALTSRGFSVPPQLQRRDAPSQPALDRADHVVLLLPLSGPLKAVGEAVRDGFLSARFADRDNASQIRIVDSGGDASTTVSAYRRAVSEGAQLVVGPLTRDAVGALFAEDDLPVPVLALNRGPGVTPRGHFSFALAPEDEGGAIAARLLQRGLTRVVAVVSNDDAAQRALATLRQRLERSGGSILSTITVDERSINFQQSIRDGLLAAHLPTTAPDDPNDPHDPGFDALFIAVRPAPARLLIPQLKLFGLSEVPMLGTSLIHSAAGDARLDRELSGVEFCDSPWLIDDLPGMPARAEMAAQLDSARGPAARLFAFGMDAWRLLRQIGSSDPSMAIPGATGMLSIDEAGEAQREPGMAVFRNGRPRPVLDGRLIPDGGPQG